MVLSKRERVIRTLELDDEPDVCPIHFLGFERSNTAYQTFIKTDEFTKNHTVIKNDFSPFKYEWAGEITECRYFDVDLHTMDPFKHKVKIKSSPNPPDRPDCYIDPLSGRLFQLKPQVETDIMYQWYVDGYFTTPEIVHSYWEKYGRPSELINDRVNYSPQIWEKYVKSLEKYLYPMARLEIAMHESLFEGMTIARVVYYMRKDPQFIHEVMSEYTKVNVEIAKRLCEAGIDIIRYADDLGMKGRSIFSLKQFREFILPYYKKIYQECKKGGAFVVQHSCGYIDKLLPDMVDAGLNGIQALEPAAGVDLAHLKETLGDKVALLGGMDSSRILSFGTPKDVVEDVKNCLKAAGKGGGYFAGPSHNILNVPWENVVALRDAMLKYRKYPLKV
jgi:hypothetical protein